MKKQPDTRASDMAGIPEDASAPDVEDGSASAGSSEPSEPSAGDSPAAASDGLHWAAPADISGNSGDFIRLVKFTPGDGGGGRPGVTFSTPDRAPPDAVAVTALFETCDGAAGGQVTVGRLLEHLRTQLPDLGREWLQAVAQVLDPDGQEVTVTADMFRDAVCAVNRTHAQLLQPGVVPEDTPPSRSPPAAGGLGVGRFSVGSRASSLGILHGSQILDMSSGSSYEGVGQQMSPVDIPALEGTIAQLQHSGRALQEERDQLQLQLLQLEEANQQLAAELAQLTDKTTSMSVELRRIPWLRQESERLQTALEAESRRLAAHRQQAADQERMIAAQQHEMDLLASKLSSAEVEASRAAGREDALHCALEEVRTEADLLRHDLQDREERNEAAQATIAALHGTIREMRDTSLALQDEKSRASHELSSVRRQLTALRLSTPNTGGDTSRSGPSSLQPNGSIHDEIISTIQTTGDGDPVLPLSGIASPELVQAIYDSPLNLHFKSLPRRLRMSSTPQPQPPQPSPVSPDESAELDEHYSSAASDSYDSSGMWRSRPSSVLETAVQTEPRPPWEDSVRQDTGAQTEPLERGQHSAVWDGDGQPPGPGTETGPLEGGHHSAVWDWDGRPPGPGTETRSGSVADSGSQAGLVTEEAATQTELGPEQEDQAAKSLRLWTTDRAPRRARPDATCGYHTYGADQEEEDGPALSALGQYWLRTARRQLEDGLQTPLLHQLVDLFHQQETMFAGGSGYSSAGPGAGMKRTHSDGALSAPLRTRFCSMPTVEEVPDDPDTDIPQHSPLRASFSLPCDPNEVGIFPSLTEHMLADLHFHSDENANNTNEKDLESKFCSLALAFKTDRLTLHERLDVQRRHRDQAEQNLDMEAQRFREQLMMLTQSDADRSEQMKSLQRQLDLIKQISQRLSRTAEVLGAAQQELRVSRAVEVMTQHVESLRHLYEREHAELEEARRVLATNNIALHEPAQKAAPGGRRRASIAVFAPRSAGQPLGGGLSGLSGPLASHPGQLSPPPVQSSSPTPAASGLRRRRNSLGAGDADEFGAIREEKEEERTESEQSSEQQHHHQTAASSSGDQGLQQGQLHHPQTVQEAEDGGEEEEEDLRTHMQEAVTDELATLRSEQEQLANDLKTLLSRQRDAVLQQTTTVGKLLWDVAHAWPYSREQTVARARYCVGGLFLLLAVMVLLVPPAYTTCNTQPHAFYSWAELLSPHLSLRHVHRPPL